MEKFTLPEKLIEIEDLDALETAARAEIDAIGEKPTDEATSEDVERVAELVDNVKAITAERDTRERSSPRRRPASRPRWPISPKLPSIPKPTSAPNAIRSPTQYPAASVFTPSGGAVAAVVTGLNGNDLTHVTNPTARKVTVLIPNPFGGAVAARPTVNGAPVERSWGQITDGRLRPHGRPRHDRDEGRKQPRDHYRRGLIHEHDLRDQLLPQGRRRRDRGRRHGRRRRRRPRRRCHSLSSTCSVGERSAASGARARISHRTAPTTGQPTPVPVTTT